MEMTWQSVKAILREVIREEMGMDRCALARRFEGGKLVIQPADENLKAREIPVETFFRKVTSVRDKLRVVEQRINSHPTLSVEDKAELQTLISRAYGSLTTFNFLFQDDDDKFGGMSS